MTHIVQHLKRHFTSTRFDVKAAQLILWCIALIIMVGGIHELTRFELTESQFFFGVLLIMLVTLQIIVGGLLLPIVEFVSQQRKSE